LSAGRQALAWGALYLLLALAPLIVAIMDPRGGGGGLPRELAAALGFVALTMMALQFFLSARFRRATRPLGIDLVWYLHRYLAWAVLILALAHPLILLAVSPAARSALHPLDAPAGMNSGTASVVLLLLVVVLSVARRRLGLRYERWRVLHWGLASGAFALALAHTLSSGRYAAAPGMRLLLGAVGISVLALVVRIRLLRPARLLRRPWRVETVTLASEGTWSVHLAPEGHGGFRHAPGQFVWLTLGASPFAMQEHPFSIASSPREDGRLELLVRELGDFTRGFDRVRPGDRAWVDGPWGSFSPDQHPGASGYLFVAGGIGLAPVLGMLRTLADRGDRRPLTLISAHRILASIPARDELLGLQERLDLSVIEVLEEPPEDWTGEQGRVTRELLRRALPPEARGVHAFVCGPVPLTRAVEKWLPELGVGGNRVHTELFDLV